MRPSCKQYPPYHSPGFSLPSCSNSTRFSGQNCRVYWLPGSYTPVVAAPGSQEIPEIATALAALNATEAIEPLLAILPVGGDAEKYKAEIDALSQLGDASLVEIFLDRIEQHPNAFHGIEIAVFAGLGRRELGWLTDALIRAASQRKWGDSHGGFWGAR